MNQIPADLRLAWRALWARPAFSAIAIVSLALGIGANTAIFSVIESTLLRGLPWSFLKSMLFDVSPTDLVAYAGSILMIVLIAVLASMLPALRAAKTDPVSALRYE